MPLSKCSLPQELSSLGSFNKPGGSDTYDHEVSLDKNNDEGSMVCDENNIRRSTRTRRCPVALYIADHPKPADESKRAIAQGKGKMPQWSSMRLW